MEINSKNQIAYFAETNFRNQRKRFGIKRSDRRHHMYVLGKTGMGKTTLLENMILSDIHNGEGLGVIDPHGDLIERLLDRIPSRRINDVINFNPGDLDYPIALNMLERVPIDRRSLLVSGVLSIFKKLYQDFWGPRMEYVFRNAILTVLEKPGANLFTLTRVLTDLDYRERVTKNLEDQVLRDFWLDEFASFDKRQRTEVVSPILNKVGQFLADPLMRNIVGQRKNKIKFRDVLDSRKILLINLSKGIIGEDNSALLGSLLLTKLQLAALSRAELEEGKRQDFYLYVDECHNFLTENVASMLAEMRKYRLNLIMANQHLDQLGEDIRNSILGNVGTIITFRVGPLDAEILKEEFSTRFTKDDLLTLPKYQIYLKLMIDGVVSEGFSADSLSPWEMGYNNREKVIRVSREKYGMQL